MIRLILNVLWLVLGGVWMALGWWLAGVIMLLSILGIPWARSCFVIGAFSLWPFGREAVRRDTVTGQKDLGTGCLGIAGNVLWVVVAGWWLMLGHLAAAIANAVTIIGIPFAVQHLKLALIALIPVGQTIVDRRTLRASRAAL